MPWQKTPNPLLANDENYVPAGSKLFGPLAPNLTRTGGVGLSNVSERGAPKGPVEDFRADSVLKSMNYSTSNYPSPYTNHARKTLRALSRPGLKSRERRCRHGR